MKRNLKQLEVILMKVEKVLHFVGKRVTIGKSIEVNEC